MMSKEERNNMIKELYEKGLFEQLYKEVIEVEANNKIEAGNVRLGQKIVIEDENGRETWTAITYQDGGTVFLLDKEYAIKNVDFGNDNNYSNSNARTISCTCEPVLRLLKKYGSNAFIPLEIDLFSHDGLRDYGVCKGDLTGIMTYDMYRNNREYIKPSCMWLATPDSTPSGTGASCVRCVGFGGGVGYDDCGWDVGGVRPFCIIKSSIFVSYDKTTG